MGLQENNAKSKDDEVKVKTDQKNLQTQYLCKKLKFIPQPKFSGACGPLTGHKF